MLSVNYFNNGIIQERLNIHILSQLYIAQKRKHHSFSKSFIKSDCFNTRKIKEMSQWEMGIISGNTFLMEHIIPESSENTSYIMAY